MGRACFKGRTCAMRLMSRYDPKSLYALIITLIRYDHVFSVLQTYLSFLIEYTPICPSSQDDTRRRNKVRI